MLLLPLNKLSLTAQSFILFLKVCGNEFFWKGYHSYAITCSRSADFTVKSKIFTKMKEIDEPFHEVTDTRQQGRHERPVFDFSFERRLRFVRYTHGLLTLQFLISLSLSCAAIHTQESGFGHLLSLHMNLIWVPVLINFFMLSVVGCYPSSSKYKIISAVGFLIFTVCKSMALAFLSVYVKKPFESNLVFVQLVMMTVTVACLALYASRAKKRFEMFNGGIAIYVPGLILLMVFWSVQEIPFFYTFLCLCGTIIFGVMILLETKTLSESDHLIGNFTWGTIAYYLGPFIIFWACVEAVSPIKKRRRSQ